MTNQWQSNFNYKYYIIFQQKLNSIYSYVIICFILTPFLTLPSQPLLPFPLKLQNFTTPNGSLMSVCVQIWHLFYIRDRRYRFENISVCLINEYLLIVDLHILFMDALNALPFRMYKGDTSYIKLFWNTYLLFLDTPVTI